MIAASEPYEKKLANQFQLMEPFLQLSTQTGEQEDDAETQEGEAAGLGNDVSKGSILRIYPDCLTENTRPSPDK